MYLPPDGVEVSYLLCCFSLFWSDFIVTYVFGPYVLNRPALISYSIERRLMPRHYVIRILKAKGLLSKEIDFYSAVCITEEKFLEKFILPYNKSFPGLIDAYAAACRGQVTLEL